MPFLAALGAIGWPLIKWLVPALPAKATLYLIVALGLVASHGAVAGYVWFKGYESRVEAVADAKAEFRETLDRERREHEGRVTAAVEAGKNEQPVSADRAERLRQCKRSATCRESRGQ
jgi:hypothetical protein